MKLVVLLFVVLFLLQRSVSAFNGLYIQDSAGACASRGGGVKTPGTLCKKKKLQHTNEIGMYVSGTVKKTESHLRLLPQKYDATKLTKNLVQDEKMPEIPQNLRISRSYELNVYFVGFCFA